MMSYGSKGEDVRELQTALKRAGCKIEVDGHYGNETKYAVCDFQQLKGLPVDGIAGPETLAALAPYYISHAEILAAVEECVAEIEKLPEYQKLEALLYG